MRILFILPFLPLRPRAGNELMAFHHLSRLCRSHVVDVLCFGPRPSTSKEATVTDLCRRCEVVPELSFARRIVLAALGAFWGEHPYVASRRSRAMSRAVKERLGGGDYDVAIFFGLAMAQFAPASSSTTRCFWNPEDPPVLRMRRLARLAGWLWRPVMLLESILWKLYESRVVSRFERIFLFPNDLQACEEMPKGRLGAVPYGIDSAYYRPPLNHASRREPGMVVITGNMYHPPNVQAVNYFCRDIFPLIRRDVPEAKLWLVGARPSRSVRRWANAAIEVTGSVPDIRPYLQRAMVSVCPVRLQIGMQTKILEALASGTPVVTTPEGNFGVGGVDGKNLRVANTPQEFANRVVSLLKGEDWEKLSKGGMALAEERFSWSRSVEQLEQLISPTYRPSVNTGREQFV